MSRVPLSYLKQASFDRAIEKDKKIGLGFFFFLCRSIQKKKK